MKEKSKWSQPKIETVELKFDKVMQTSCWGSYSTPQNPQNDACGYAEGYAHMCWNSNNQ